MSPGLRLGRDIQDLISESGKKYNFFLFAAWVAFAATTAVFMGPGWLWRAPGVQKRPGDRKTMTTDGFAITFVRAEVIQSGA